MILPPPHQPGPHLIAALVTPFTIEHEIDRASLARLVTYLGQGGIDEFFVVSSTGESPLIDDHDRLTLIETVRAATPDGVIYAGVSGPGYRASIRHARDAAKAGADVGVLMCPQFMAFAQDQLAAYCETVADASPLPLAIYHHLRMPTPFAVPTVARLAAHPNIVAIKDTNGGDHNRCAEILTATTGQNFKFLQGVEKLLLPTLEAGGHGGVLAQACLAPRLFRELRAAWQTGDKARAQEIQSRVTQLWSIFTRNEVRQSFCHFLHTLKLPLHQRGLLATTAGAMPSVTFDAAFERMIEEFMREHLESEPVLPSRP
jgi:4-hydroxy-tetrahydrodipicolinate synthase